MSMKERPIIFSAPIVRAILDGKKTQERRVVKFNASHRVQLAHRNWHIDDPNAVLACPCGVVGDWLWVKESFQPLLADGIKWNDADYSSGEGYAVNYVATSGVRHFFNCADDDAFCDKVTPSTHMPRWASRITMEITDVRVQRLQDISEEDAIAEGSGCILASHKVWDGDPDCYRKLFSKLWNSINGKSHPWESNPWVWAVTFKRVMV